MGAALSTRAWIGLAHVQPCEPDRLDGCAGAYVSVLALADDAHDYGARARAKLAELGFRVLELEEVEPLQRRIDLGHTTPELMVMAGALSAQTPIVLSAFDAYEGH